MNDELMRVMFNTHTILVDIQRPMTP